jgi:hypothetical protein
MSRSKEASLRMKFHSNVKIGAGEDSETEEQLQYQAR